MPDAVDYYEALGVPRDADQAAIKKAFRKLAREHHPDANPDDPHATERFKRIGEAYAVLGDPEKRAQYDRYGQVNNGGGPQFDSDLFGDLGGIFQSFFGMGGFEQQRPGGPRSGDSLVMPLDLTLEEVAHGVERDVNYRRQTTCPECFGTGAAEGSSPERCHTCDGHGQVRQQRRTMFGLTTVLAVCPTCHGNGQVIQNPCRRCRGEGRVQETVNRTVKVPPGLEEGVRVKVSGGGDTGQQGGPPGDLYLQVRVKRHPTFQRDGSDLFCELPISFAQAALGDTLLVPGIDHPHTLQLPAGTQTGAQFRIPGGGLPAARSPQHRGNLYVQVLLVTPTSLTEEQKELLFKFAHAGGEHELEPEEKSFFERLVDAFKRK
ncbi:MAG: molecular chaperone DnaJ [Fimbriimonadaceae bacterium]|nr:molecular chaperone DnaJ [Fimbriimonadaceae bacterium]